MYLLSIIKKIILVQIIQCTMLSSDFVMKPDGTLTLQTTQDNSIENNQIINAVSVEIFGAIGDGIKDDTVAIQNAIKSESKLYFPEGRYKVSNSIYLRSDTVLISENATIYYIREHGVDELWPAFYFETDIHNVDMLGHWIFEGDSPHSAFNKAIAGPSDTYVTGLKIKTGCSDIYIESFEGFNFTGAAFSIGTHSNLESSRNITVDKMKLYNCWNANLEITSGTDIHLKDVETYGSVSNSKYAQIGIDIEVNHPDDILATIQIDKLVTHNNDVGFQILTMSQAQKGITINDIASFDNNENGINLLNSTDFNVANANIYNNKGAGLYITGTFKNISIDNGSLFNNQNHGVLAQMDASRGIKVSSKNLNIGVDIYNNHGYGILLSGTEKYPVKKFTCSGKIYDNQNIKTQETGIDVQKNVLDIMITGTVNGNKYFQIRE